MMKRLFALLTAGCLALACTPALADEADQAVWSLPGKADALNSSLTGVKVDSVEWITGEDSPNKTLSRFNVWGTDLGAMAEMNGKVYMFGGDTFSDANSNDWRSNVLFVIEDDDPSDGLTITGAVVDGRGKAKELIRSRKRDGDQVTCIPTNIFAVDDTLYCIYMSVSHWNEKGGSWECGYSGLTRSTDEGKTWEKLTKVTWPGDSNFIQTANYRVGDTMYLWGIPAGRFGGVALMKCDVRELEDLEAYSYFTGCDDSGEPQWVRGSEGIPQAKVIIRDPVGEISVIYNEYLGNFIMTYLNEDKAAVVMREGVTPWGPWSDEAILAAGKDYASLYGGFMCDKYVEDGGKTFYFAMSQFFPLYNIRWMKAELPDIQR